jgi:hypothetical protein
LWIFPVIVAETARQAMMARDAIHAIVAIAAITARDTIGAIVAIN